MKLNLPNVLVIARFIMAFIVVIMLSIIPHVDVASFDYANLSVSLLSYFSGIIFLFAAFTDWLDGYLARKNNDITNFGKIFDPLADKFIVNSVLIIFTVFGRVPIFFTVLFIFRDLLVDGLRIFLAANGKVLSAQTLGKQKTLWQFIGLFLLFFIYPSNLFIAELNWLALIPLTIALVFSLMSGIKYFYDNWNFLKE